MKRAAILIIVIVACAAVALAQAPSAAIPTPQSGAKPGQAPATQQAPAQQPAQPSTQPGAAQAPAQPAGKRPPAAKTQEELAAFQAAAPQMQNPDANAAEKAAEEFSTKFPDSELRSLLYQQLMGRYQANNNAEKTVEMGRKVLQIEPDNAVAAVITATVLAERTRETDIDRNEKLAEAIKDANHAIQTVDSMAVPAGAPPERVAAAKKMVVSMAYSALGSAEAVKQNYPAAEKYYKQSIQEGEASPDPLTFLRLAITLDKQQKYQDALPYANKALEIAQAQQAAPQVIAMAQQQRDRLAKLTGAPATSPATGTPTTSGGTSTPPPATKPPAAGTQPTTPAAKPPPPK